MKTFIVTIIGLILAALFLGLAPVQAGVTSDPYTGTPINVPIGATIFEAANYDKGAEGVAFHNPNPGICEAGKCSCVQAYRFGELPICSGTTPFITYTDAGLWAQYTIQVQETGNYSVELLIGIGDAVCCSGAAYHIELDGIVVTKSMPLGPTVTTSGWTPTDWRGGLELIPMVPGIHKLRIVVDKGWFNLDSIRITRKYWIDWIWTPVWKAAP